MKETLKNNNGFSLLELIITLAILSIIIIPISSLFINSAKATNSANYKMIALSIAQSEMERVKLQDDLEDQIKENDKFQKPNEFEYKDFSYKIVIEKANKTNQEGEKNIKENKNILDNNIKTYNSSEKNISNEENINQKKELKEIEIDSSKLTEDDYYILNIINDSGDTYEIKTNLNNSQVNQNGTLNTKERYISIFIKEKKLNKNNETPIKIEVSNKSIRLLEIYTEKDQNISIINKLGEIKIYKNYNKEETTSELYKINIKVYKGDKDDIDKELIEEIEGYKNIVQ